MALALDEAKSWGCSLADYTAMFDLGDAERRLSILGCGDGASSFNAEGTAQGMRIVSVDPLYDLRTDDVRARIEATPADAARLAAMQGFLADYEEGISQGRYVYGDATSLPFPDGSFDLALCSHRLFIHGTQQDLAFELKAIMELGRVAEEIRVYPVLDADGGKSRHLRAVMLAAQRKGAKAELRSVAGNQMLRLSR